MAERDVPAVRVTFDGDGATLDADARHYLLRVRRLRAGDAVVCFDASGRHASGVLTDGGVRLTGDVGSRMLPPLVVCCCVPKGGRGDVIAEKLGELGVTRWVPLVARRSVVEPGVGKVERWRRLATSAAGQSRSYTPMQVDEPVALSEALAREGPGVVLATERAGGRLTGDVRLIYVGPEGGWDAEELDTFNTAGCVFASLGVTVLRVETAAIVAAGVVRVAGRAR